MEAGRNDNDNVPKTKDLLRLCQFRRLEIRTNLTVDEGTIMVDERTVCFYFRQILKMGIL